MCNKHFSRYAKIKDADIWRKSGYFIHMYIYTYIYVYN